MNSGCHCRLDFWPLDRLSAYDPKRIIAHCAQRTNIIGDVHIGVTIRVRMNDLICINAAGEGQRLVKDLQRVSVLAKEPAHVAYLLDRDYCDCLRFLCTTKPTGMGLGLAICRTVAQDHGGNLRLVETSSHGSIFEIELPIASTDDVPS